MEIMSAKEAAAKWGISQRRVSLLCSQNRISNATMKGNMWLIPADCEKPADARATRYTKGNSVNVKPFLKWAGGKGQLLREISEYYPFGNKKITKYAEPFVGGGAVLFDILNRYEIDEIYISDTNRALMDTYIAIKDDVDSLVNLLLKYQNEYIPLSFEQRKVYYMAKREHFNDLLKAEGKSIILKRAALLIFLNKTCFNGLYRVNKKGYFNVPIGSYKNPTICDKDNLRAVSKALQGIIIECVDYRHSIDFIDDKTFVYLDPPYRPLTQTSGFTAYTEYEFGDKEQFQLAEFVGEIDKKGASFLLSNSDPRNMNPDDNFFDDLYSSYSINRVEANRMINSNAAFRGKIRELLISNM